MGPSVAPCMQRRREAGFLSGKHTQEGSLLPVSTKASSEIIWTSDLSGWSRRGELVSPPQKAEGKRAQAWRERTGSPHQGPEVFSTVYGFPPGAWLRHPPIYQSQTGETEKLQLTHVTRDLQMGPQSCSLCSLRINTRISQTGAGTHFSAGKLPAKILPSHV